VKYVIYTLALVLLFGVNLGLFGRLPIYGQVPNLLFLLVLYFALEKKDYDFFFIAFLSGIILDFFSAHFFGAFTFTLLFLSSFLHLLARNFIVVELDKKALVALLLGSWAVFRLLLGLLAVLALRMHLTSEAEGLKMYFNGFVWSLIYNLLLLYPVYLFYGYLRKIVDNLTVRRRRLIG